MAENENRENHNFFLGALFAAALALLLLTFKKWAGLFGLGAGAGAGAGAGGAAGAGGGYGAGSAAGSGGCGCGGTPKYPPPPNYPTNPSTAVNPILGYAAPTSSWAYKANPPAPEPVNSGDIFLQRNPVNPNTGINIFGQTVQITPDNTVLN